VEQAALVRASADHGDRTEARPYLPAAMDASEFTALADLCLATLNLNEFAFVR
jgi:hypothetical protein